ncbi:hypothetical protein BWP39_28325 [Paraburkholderia acidicola]|uniref:Filamentous haemagglutinin FhaB/tRNA nuclease CdiA-like TPS domain-containing protein n=1 Tax=Paraburkholderia acidicola TaxID=1912599 RepID=A0A2A4ET49_9BURK|nr:hemagglutinin repeat-containing protein [Paraburkholderia acidicola]PCE23590.1 hypothetical protein BWP39_28325 [Paraburkholderia acidicola]
MNKNCYRVIFNRARGALMVVQENGLAPHAAGNRSASGALVVSAILQVTRRPIALAAMLLLGVPAIAMAQIVAAPGSGAHVIQTQNGLPQVDVARPSGAGVSVNTYNQFDVQRAGAILNNSPTIVQTRQAGYINGNPNFGANDAARIIVNQVNSNNPSQLRGFVEVAGQRADVVIANPSGLMVDGGGFINTGRATLTTGLPFYGVDGSLAGFNVNRGLVTVAGSGLNASGVDRVDLIARAVEANAAIYANNLGVLTGANQVNHDALATSRIQGEGAAPAVSIDIGQLGGMYANRIFLVGTEGGVGVRNAGTIAADAMGLTLTTEGRLVQAGTISALGNVAVSAAGGIGNTGTTYSQQSVSLNTGADMANSGTLAAQRHVGVNAGSVDSTGSIGAGVDSDGVLTQAGDLQITTTGQLSATGRNVTGGNATLKGFAVNLAGSTTAANGNLSLTAATGDVNLANATTIAQGSVTVNAASAFINDYGEVSAGTNLHATGLQSIDNSSGSLKAGQHVVVDAGSRLTNAGGTIAGQVATVNGTTIDNSTGTVQAVQVTLNGTDLVNHGGTVTQTGTGLTTVNVSGTLDNSNGGVLQTGSTNLTLAPAELINSGGTIAHAGDGTLTIAPGVGTGHLKNDSGLIASKGQAVVNAGDLNNAQGILSAQRGINATVRGDIDNTKGLIRSDTELFLANGGALVNRAGHIQAGQTTADDTGTLDVQSASIDNTDGSINNLGTGRMNVQGGSRIVNSHAGGVSGMGRITGNGEVTIDATSITNDHGGQLSGASLRVRGTTLDNRGGQIGNVEKSTGDVDVTMTGAITNTEGQISSTYDLTVTASTLAGGGAYNATHDVTVNLRPEGSAPGVHAEGSAPGGGGNFIASPDVQFNAGHDLSFTLPGQFINGANLQSVNNLSVEAQNISNTGSMQAGALLRTHSTDLTNTGTMIGGSVSLAAGGTLSNLDTKALIGASDSDGTLEILARLIENRDDSTATDTIAQPAIFGLGRVVLAGGKDADGNYTNAARVNNVSALLQSGGDMALHADRVLNTRREMKTSGITSEIDPAALEQYGISMKGCAAYYVEACSGHDVGWIRLTRNPEKPEYDPAPFIAKLRTLPGGLYTDPPHEGRWNSGYQYTTYEGKAVANTVTQISPAGQIISGGVIDTASVGAMQNLWSNIASAGDFIAPASYETDGWKATGQQAPGVTVTYSGHYHYNNYNNTRRNWTLPFGDARFVGQRPRGYAQAAPADVRQYSLPGYESTWGANGKLTGTDVSINNTAGNAGLPSLGLLPGQSVPGLTIAPLIGSASGASIQGGPPTIVDPVIASATALNVLTSLTIPRGGLYRPNPSPGAGYMIETNPAFTNQKSFISSDYFFNQIGVDLIHIPKRLGDGFYEQQLVRNQVTALTGRAVLGPYTDLQTMYQSLMTAGAALDRQLDLPVGASLSAAQVSTLTGNVIMMETRVVDGQSVLVPVVYLAKTNQQNINGPLITATDIDFQNTQSFANSGTVKADNTLSVQGRQIDNALGARQSAGLMSLMTTGNVDLTSANVKAGSLALNAGGDLILDTATRTDNRVSRDGATSVVTTLGPTARLDVANDASIATGGNFRQNAGNLTVGGNLETGIGGNWALGTQQTGEHKTVRRANGVSDTDINNVTGSTVKVDGVSDISVGGDLTARGAQIDLNGGGTIAAEGSVSLLTASATTTVNNNSSSSDRRRSSAAAEHAVDQRLTGTTLRSGDALNIVSGKDITLSGSTLRLDKGRATLDAKGDVNVESATETRAINSHETHSRSGLVSGTKVASGVDQTATYNLSSAISADGVTIAGGRDINVTGSTIVGTDDVKLKAVRDVNLRTSQDTVQSSGYYRKKDTGLLSNGGLSVSIGSQSMTDRQQSSSVTNNASSVGALNGNLSIEAGNNVNGTAAMLHAGNDVEILGTRVRLDAAHDTMDQGSQQQYRQAGVTVGITNPVVAAVQTGRQMANAAQSVDGDPRLLALAAVTTGLAAKNTYDAVKQMGGDPLKAAASVNVNVSLGASKSDSQSRAQSNTALGGVVSAGHNVKVTATGAGDDSNIDVTGSTISAGNDTKLKSDGRINLQAAENTSSLHGTNSGSSVGVGVTVGLGAQSGVALTASAAGNRGRASGDSSTWTNSYVMAGNTLTLESDGDTNMRGAVASGRQVVTNVAGNLNIESRQDRDYYDSKQQNAGIGVSVCPPPCLSSVSGSVGQTKMKSDYASVTGQSGIRAGDGGFQVDVKGNTDLKGGVIASSDKAVAEHRNSLKTATLTTSDIENHASYDASKVALSGGYSFGGDSHADDGNRSGIGKDQKGKADNVNPVPGTALAKSDGGLSVAPPVVLGASGEAKSTTRSGISGGGITITDPEAQQRLTGRTAEETVAGVNRDTADTGGALVPIFDKEKIQAGFEIAGQFVNQVGTFVANRAAEADAAKKAATDPDLTPEQRATAQQRADQLNADWGPGGTYRQVLTALTVAAGGNVMGGAGQFAQGATVAYLQELGASHVKQLADDLGSEEARAALHAIVGCAGAATSNQSCSAGAMGAATSSVLGRLLAPTDGMTTSEREARANLVTSLVAGIAEVSGQNGMTAAGAGKIEVENNQVAMLMPKGMMDYGQAQASLGQFMLQNGATPEEIVQAQAELARGKGLNYTDPVSGLLKGWVLLMSTAATAGLGPAAGAGAAIAGGVIGGAANAGAQLATKDSGSFSYIDALIAIGTGALTQGKGIVTTSVTSMGGAFAGSVIKGEDPVNSVIGAGMGSMVGSGVGKIVTDKVKPSISDAVAEVVGSGSGAIISEAIDFETRDRFNK